MKNVTYLFGAGASRNAMPIWKEQAESMVSMALYYFNFNLDESIEFKPEDFLQPNFTSHEKGDYIMWDMGRIGLKGLEFNTVDTYSKKLVLNKDFKELAKLKRSVSVFFTLWQLCENLPFKNVNRYRDTIDRRYISFLASLLVDKNEINPILPENINVISWNYDLQFEFGYKMFCKPSREWKEICQTLKFRSNDNDKLQVCHLNGFHGFFKYKNKDVTYMEFIESKDIIERLKSIEFMSVPDNLSRIDFENHINYAWEHNIESNSVISRSVQILENTDYLVIIGYSFPTFNRMIDQKLFASLSNKCKIIYQDPNSNYENIGKVWNNFDKNQIDLVKETEYFYYPL